nr:hypothetical protein [Planctomycetota bacterium]
MGVAVAESRTWSGSGDWSNPANWTPAGVPTTTSAVVFDGTSTAACAIDAAATPTVAGLAIAASYSGTITQSAGTAVVVGALGFAMDGGNLVASAAGISVAGDWTKTGGTFTAGSSTVTFNPGAGLTCVLTSGGTGAGSSFANLTFAGAGTLRPATDALRVTGDLVCQAGAGTFDGATNDRSVTVDDDVILDNATVSMGDGTWTIGGDFDFADVATFTQGTSSVVMTGTGTDLTGPNAVRLHHLTISGETRIRVFMTCARLTVSDRCEIDVGVHPDEVLVAAAALITGAGELGVFWNASIAQMDGVIDCATLRIVNNHDQNIPPARYDSALVQISNIAPFALIFRPQAGTYIFAGDVEISNSSTNDFTIDNDTNDANYVFEGSLTLSNTGGGTLTWTKGSGTLTFSGAGSGTQSLDFLDKSVEAIVIDDAGTRKQLTTNGVTTTALTVTAGTFDLNGENLARAAAGAVVNDAVIRLQGSETLTNITNLDLDSGTVIYTGRGATETLALRDFGATDYHHLVLDEGLLAYWKLDESGSPATLADASGRGRTATAAGGPAATATVPAVAFTDPASLTFDGVDDRAAVTLDLSTTATVTLAFWLWWDAFADDDDLAFEFCPVGLSFNVGGGGFLVDPNSGNGGLGRFEVAVKGDAGYNNALFLRPSAGAWHHYALVLDKSAAAADEVTPYVDGAAVAYVKLDSNENTNAFAAHTLFFMSRPGPNLCGAGRLDDVRIYDRALTPLEISALVIGNQGTAGTTTWALAADLAVAGDLTLSGGVLDVGVANRAISVTGSWRNHGAMVEPRAGTVTLAGALGGEVISGSATFHDLAVSGAGTYVMGDRLRVEDTLTIGPGTLDVSSGRWPLHAGSIVQTSGALIPRDGVATVIVGGAVAGSLSTTATLNRLRVEGDDDPGLVGYWKLDEGAGATLRDRSGNGRHCAVVGAPRWIADTPSGPTFQNPAGMEFSGGAQGAVGRRPLIAVDDWTLAAWMRPSVLPQVEAFVVYVGDDNGGYGFSLGGNGTNNAVLYGLYGQIAWMPTGYTVAAAGVWHHVAMRRSAGTVGFWVDGVQTANTYAATPNAPTDDFTIGYQWNYGGRDFAGAIDDVRVYDRPLTVAEIRNLANGRYAAGASGPVTTLGADLVVDTMTLDSGVFTANGRAVTVTGPVSLAQGGGAWIAGAGNHVFDGGFTMSGSAFTGGSGTMDINGAFAQLATIDPQGGVAQSGGSFTAPSSTLSVSGGFTRDAGTFAHNGGTVVLDGGSQAIAGTATTFFHLTKSVAAAQTLTFPSGVTNAQTILGTCTL